MILWNECDMSDLKTQHSLLPNTADEMHQPVLILRQLFNKWLDEL